jgi:hypothetical protein
MRFQIAVSMPIANAHGGRCHAWKPYFNRVTQRGCFWPHCLGSREELLSLYKFVMSLFVYWWCVMTGLGLGASLVCSPLRTEYHQQKTWVVQNKFPDCRNHVTGLAFDFILFFYYLTNMCSFQIWRLQIRKKWSTWMTQRSQSFAAPAPKAHPSPAGLAPAWPVARALLGRESQESWTLSLEVLSGYD